MKTSWLSRLRWPLSVRWQATRLGPWAEVARGSALGGDGGLWKYDVWLGPLGLRWVWPMSRGSHQKLMEEIIAALEEQDGKPAAT